MKRATVLRSAAAILIAGIAVSAQAQQLYRWTDSSGRTHVTDTPPPPGARGVQVKPSGAAAAPAAPSGTPSTPFVLQQLQKDFPVTVYSTKDCDACDQARKLLNARGIPFREVSVNEDAGLAELKKVAETNSVPVLVVGSTTFKGYEEGSYHRLLDAAGYPKAGLLPARNQGAPAAPQEPKAEVKPAAQPDTAPRGPYAPKPPREEKKK